MTDRDSGADLLAGDVIEARLTEAGQMLIHSLVGPVEARGESNAIRELEGLKSLSDGWDGYGAPAPSSAAIEKAMTIVKTLEALGIRAEGMIASAEGGVGFLIRFGPCAVIEVEVENDNGIGAIVIRNSETIRSADWESTSDAIVGLVSWAHGVR